MTIDDKIRAYAHSRLSQEERAAFESEMANDPALHAEVSAITAVQAALGQDVDDMPGHGWARLSDKIDAQGFHAANDNSFFRWSLLQAACIAVAAVLGWQVIGSALLSPEPATYTTASAEAAGPSVQIVFSSMAVMSDVSETLVGLDGRIVDGPSALGLYVVEFPDVATRDAAFAAMNARTDIVSEILKN